MQPNTTDPTPALSKLLAAEPDLVDRIFDYIFADPVLSLAIKKSSVSNIKAAVRAEFKGEECYIASRPATERQRTVAQVLALFNGRNATEVARKLQISRATVYRVIKQPGSPKPATKQSHLS
jgi:Mor family transcriptional regulator